MTVWSDFQKSKTKKFKRGEKMKIYACLYHGEYTNEEGVTEKYTDKIVAVVKDDDEVDITSVPDFMIWTVSKKEFEERATDRVELWGEE